MKRQYRDSLKHKYCALGPHRLEPRGHKISASYLYASFKAYVGDSWADYHPEAKICTKCQSRVRNFGRRLGTIPEVRIPANMEENTPKDGMANSSNEVSSELSQVELSEHSPLASCSHYPESSEDSFYSAQQSIVSSQLSGLSFQSQPSHPISQASQSVIASTSTGGQTVYMLTSITACSLSQRSCVICGEEKKESRHRIPKPVVKNLWHVHRIMASHENRSCLSHHDGSQFNESAIACLEASAKLRMVNLKEDALYDWITAVTLTGGTSPKYLFDEHGIPASRYSSLVGITKESFDDLLSYIEGHMRNSSNRSKRQALAMWLMLMKTGLTQDHLGMDFDVDQKTVSNACKVVGELIHKYFTPRNLGFGSITREDVIENHNRKTTQIALSIPDGKVISIADGTYLFVDKPVGHAEQRFTFHAQKMRNFYRMMMIVACSGRIIDCIGPFPATWNDSKALEWILENTGFLDFMGDGTIILDRGFKSCEPKLKEKGLTVYSPQWLGADEKQMNVEKGAKSRLVTMCRWQVEGANGRVKQKFQFFKDDIPGRYSANIASWFMNVCAIINKYGATGFTETARNINFAKTAVERAKVGSNQLCEKLKEAGKIKCTAAWKKMDSTCLTDFPRLTYDDLEAAALGSYHANEAKRYIAQHMSPSGLFELRYHKEFPEVVRTQIHSRFQSSAIHSAWIQYSPNQDGMLGILDHYCTCKAGARKVSCCAHVATALRYLGMDRFAEDVTKRKSNRVRFLGIQYPDNTA